MMITSSRFPVAVHILALLAMQQRSLSSTYIAGSVNTNPVVIRRILHTLSQAGLVTTQLGSDGGATLARSPEAITLLEIHRATEAGELFGLRNSQPNQYCPCGSNIQPVLSKVFHRVEDAMQGVLGETTLAQVVEDIETRRSAVK